jgi:hypothetical protein
MTSSAGGFEQDADDIEDDDIISTYLGAGDPAPSDFASGQLLETNRPHRMPDWPHAINGDQAISIDPKTIDWFKRHHADWRAEIAFVLRAWIASRIRTGSDTLP